MFSAELDVDFPIARVIATLDVLSRATDAVAAAVDIAARCNVELAGLFIEDDSLFRLASTPDARHMTLTSTAEASLGVDMLEAEMRKQADKAMAALGAAARARGVPWSFRSVRGMPEAMLRQATRSGDLLVLPAAMSAGGLPFRPHSPLLQAAGTAASSALIVRQPASLLRPLVVASADPGRVRRAIAAVRRLRASNHDTIDVVVPGMGRLDAGRALAELQGLIRLRELQDRTPRSVIDLARALKSDVVVLASETLALEEHGLADELLAKSDRQVLLLRQPWG